MCKNLLSPGRFRKFVTAVSLALGMSVLVNAVFIPEVHSEAIPSHLAKMAASLYKSTADDLKRPGKDPKETEMRQRALKTLRKIGIHHWAGGSVSVDEDLEKGGVRSAVIKTDDGDVVEFKWSPENESFLINVKTKPDAKSADYNITTLKGKVKTAVKKQKGGSGENLVLDVTPEDDPVRTLTPEDLTEMKANILGKWETEEGHVYTISASNKTAGTVKTKKPSKDFDRLIEDIKKEVESLKSEVVFVWKNKESKEVVRQKKFRKLKKPWSYEGEKPAAANAESEILKKERQIAELSKEKEASENEIPTPCEQIAGSPGARPVNIKIFKPEISLNYAYDSATFNGTRLCAKGKLTNLKDLGETLPIKIRQKLIANWNPPQWMELDVLLDTDTESLSLTGNRWRLSVTWSPNMAGDDGEISKIHSPYSKQITLTKTGKGKSDSLKIGKLKISYIGWEVEKGSLKNDLRLAESDLKRVNEAFKMRQEKASEHLKRVNALKDEVKEIAEKIAEQIRQLKISENNLKTAKYIDLEKKLNTQIRLIDTKIALMKNWENQPSKRTLYLNLVDDLAVRQKTLRRLEKKLATERSRLGLDKIRKEKLKKIKLVEDIFWAKKKRLFHAEGELGQAGSMQEFELNNYLQANQKYGKALKAYNQLVASGVPLVTEIKNDYYLAQLWTPGEEIKKLNENIRSLKTTLQSLRQRRSKYRDELTQLGDVMTAQTEKLVRAIWKSNLAQAGVEVADFARDMYEAGKIGPQAMLAGIINQMLELAVFGAPTYYDGKFELSGYLPSSYTEGAKKIGIRMAKTAMGAPFKAGVEKMVANQELKIYQKMVGRLYAGTWLNELIREYPNLSMKQNAENIMKILKKQDEKLAKASKNFKTSIGKQGKLALGKTLGKSFAKGMLKDIAKEALKKETAEFFEGQAMREFALAQYELQGAVMLLLKTSNHYWMTKDAYDTLAAIRNAIIEKFDPINQMVIDRNKIAKFPNGPKPYKISLADNYKPAGIASDRKISLILGGVKAERDSGGALVFTIPAEEIKNVKDRKKGAKLEIEVLK